VANWNLVCLTHSSRCSKVLLPCIPLFVCTKLPLHLSLCILAPPSAPLRGLLGTGLVSKTDGVVAALRVRTSPCLRNVRDSPAARPPFLLPRFLDSPPTPSLPLECPESSTREDQLRPTLVGRGILWPLSLFASSPPTLVSLSPLFF